MSRKFPADYYRHTPAAGNDNTPASSGFGSKNGFPTLMSVIGPGNIISVSGAFPYPILTPIAWELVGTDIPFWVLGIGYDVIFIIKDKLYMLIAPTVAGTLKNYSSSDGVTWQEDLEWVSFPKPDTGGPGAAVQGADIFISFSRSITAERQVWKTADGTGWIQQTLTAPYIARLSHAMTSLNGKLYISGGSALIGTLLNDVWESSDGGINWTQKTAAAAWTPRYAHTMIGFNNKLYVLGGDDSVEAPNPLNDVWESSDDGATWTQLTASAEWAIRRWHQTTIFKNKLVILGGQTDMAIVNDMWESSDGVTWTQNTASAGWAGRKQFGAGVLGTDLYIFGGIDNGGNRLHDVWKLAG